jgi:hypothetical protein
MLTEEEPLLVVEEVADFFNALKSDESPLVNVFGSGALDASLLA